MAFGSDLLRTYGTAIRQEPKLRAYLVGEVFDDIGVAVSVWGMKLLMTNLFTDQRERAKLMLPSLACFFVGSLLGGPIADWGARTFPQGLARFRWKVVVWARLVETVALGVAIWGVARAEPSIASMLPYYLIAAFMKTALRPTKIAFRVDLLRREETQLDADGAPVLDERGEPRPYKVHLLAFDSLMSLLSSGATLGGLLLGGQILALVGGRYAPLLMFDVATNLCFLAVVFFLCHPDRDSGVRPRDLLSDPARAEVAYEGSIFVHVLKEFGASMRDAVRFLSNRDQRPLLYLLFGAWIFEVVNEFYDGKMIIKHVLHAGDDAVRHAEIVWSIVAMISVALVPALARRVGSLGKIYLFVMLVDGIVLAFAGRSAALGIGATVPFIVLLGADQGLTAASGSLVSLAQNSASSAGMRGRITAAFIFVVILSDMAAEAVATEVSERIGIPSMVMWIGIVQVGLMMVVAIVGGRRLWNFGLRTSHIDPPASIRAPAG